jgi:hypothetical protein
MDRPTMSTTTDFFVDGIRRAIDAEARRLMKLAMDDVSKELERKLPEIITGFLIDFNKRIDMRDNTSNLVITIQKKIEQNQPTF